MDLVVTPARTPSTRRRFRAVGIRGALAAAFALLALFLIAHARGAANQVVSWPTRAQVTGTWGGDYGLNLVLRPDGTFSSDALPAQVGTAGPVLRNDESVANAWSAHGTWTIGAGGHGGSAESVIFTVDCGSGPSRCAGHPATFDLLLETNSPDGGGGPALFYYLGRTRSLSSQYPFVRVP